MKKWDIPGGSVAITKDGRLVYARGFGFAHQETQVPVFPDHQFRIASLSKPLTAMAIMQLAEAGKLGLDSLVFGEKGILSDSSFSLITDARIKEITVRQLLQHTAGWDRDLSGDPMCDQMHIAETMGIAPPADAKTIIRYMLTRPLDFQPGSRFAYSNLGYSILGRVIEKITGLSYEAYVKSAILTPLGIQRIQLGKNLLGDQAKDEVSYYDKKSGVPSVYGNDTKVPAPYGGFHLEAMDAHGGWIASASDLLRLMTAFDGFDTRPDALSPASLSEMIHLRNGAAAGYALGWCVNSRNNWWHTGSLPGTSAVLARTHDGYTWSVLFNHRSEQDNYFQELDRLIWNGVKEVQVWPTNDLFEPTQTEKDSLQVTASVPVPTIWGVANIRNRKYPYVFSESNPQVYPNPSAGLFNLEFSNKNVRHAEVVISNQKGEIVKTMNLEKSVANFRYLVSLENQPNGVYWMQVNTQDGSAQRVIVKQ